MVSWISNWAQGIIVAVIIATIIEMILPNGSSKKYVKVVIGIYILFTIISPAIEKFSNKNININEVFDTDEYDQIMAKSNESILKKIESNNNRTIKDIYISNLEADIKAKLKQKGYDAYGIYIKAKDDENYTIEQISLKINNKENKNSNQNDQKNNIVIEDINIQVKSNIVNNKKIIENDIEKGEIEASDKHEIKKYLNELYDIDITNIEVS